MHIRYFVPAVAITVALIAIGACTRPAYIRSRSKTVFGLQAELELDKNMPNVTLAYAREQKHEIPTGMETGLFVLNSCENAAKGECATETPQVLSESEISVQAWGPSSFYELYAVGDTAVKSDTAQTMFFSTAQKRNLALLNQAALLSRAKTIRSEFDKIRSCLTSAGVAASKADDLMSSLTSLDLDEGLLNSLKLQNIVKSCMEQADLL